MKDHNLNDKERELFEAGVVETSVKKCYFFFVKTIIGQQGNSFSVTRTSDKEILAV